MKNKKIIGLFLISIVLFLTACNSFKSSKVVIFSNYNDNGTSRNFYLSANTESNLQNVVFNNTNFNNQLKLLDTIIYHYSLSKTPYLVMMNNQFVKNINFLLNRLVNIISSPTKFITIDQEIEIKNEKLLNLVEIKFDLIKMGFTLGYQVGNFLINKFSDDEKINFSILEYENDLNSRLLKFGFLTGLDHINKNKFNYIRWGSKLNINKFENEEVKKSVAIGTKKLLKQKNFRFIFNPYMFFNNDILSAFMFKDKSVLQYLVTVDNIVNNFGTIQSNEYLLATINRNFFSTIKQMSSDEQIKNNLLTDWSIKFYLPYILKDPEDYFHSFFNLKTFKWEIDTFNKSEQDLLLGWL